MFPLSVFTLPHAADVTLLALHAKHSTINACLSAVCSHLCVYTASDVSMCTVDGFKITETDT